MRLTLISQPPGSNLCGQAVVATLLGITLDASVELFGHSHSTRTRELVTALRANGYTVPGRLVRVSKRRHMFVNSIWKVRWKKSGRSHWVLHWGGVDSGRVYDTGFYNGGVTPLTWRLGVPSHKISSFLPITVGQGVAT